MGVFEGPRNCSCVTPHKCNDRSMINAAVENLSATRPRCYVHLPGIFSPHFVHLPAESMPVMVT